ncbi:MAG: glycine cleavage system protein H [Kiritimatiellae bacterium]|nr:glycine cleavage system protein H [Kiritimatiellia bacterium]MDD5519539.1 glycine cleavage system protein H [Kiritimatiellia bacterium]
MSNDLELTIDKFTFHVPTDRHYSEGGVWAFWMQPQGKNRIRVGLTDYLQQHSGDVAFVTAKPVGTKLVTGDDLAEVETMKTMLALPAPVNGTVVEVNHALDANPELVNQDPYDKGWIMEIETVQWETDNAKLLDPQSYLAVMKSQVEKELKES